MPDEDGVENTEFVKSELILVEDGNALAGAFADFAAVRIELAGEYFQKSGFTGTVCADQAITVAGSELDVDVLEDDSLAIGERNVGCGNHGCFLKIKANRRTPMA
jgi:hypothetical protein